MAELKALENEYNTIVEWRGLLDARDHSCETVQWCTTTDKLFFTEFKDLFAKALARHCVECSHRLQNLVGGSCEGLKKTTREGS